MSGSCGTCGGNSNTSSNGVNINNIVKEEKTTFVDLGEGSGWLFQPGTAKTTMDDMVDSLPSNG